MLDAARRAAVKTVKPRVDPEVWRRLTSLDPKKKATARRKARAAAAKAAAKAAAAKRPAVGGAATNKQLPLAERDLASLAQLYGTDKWGTHRYAPHYQRHLSFLKDETFTLLEIGIGGYSREKQGGASLRMWKAFFPKAEIIGLDIEDKSFVVEPRITAFKGSQTNAPLLRTIVASADNLRVVVDDGSHRPEHIRATFEILFPLLPDGAIYAIEDTQTSYWPTWGGSLDLDDKTTTMALVKSLIDGLHYEEYRDEGFEPSYTDLHVVAVHCYHNLVFIEKGHNNEGTNRHPTRWKTR